MKFTNLQIQYLWNWLNVPLHGPESRNRNKFVAIIDKQYKDSLEGRTDILAKFADKDPKTKKAIIENGVYKMADDVLEKAKKEMGKFLEGEVEYKLTKIEKGYVKSVTKTLNDSKASHDIETGKIYDQIMEILEAVK